MILILYFKLFYNNIKKEQEDLKEFIQQKMPLNIKIILIKIDLLTF